jgi:hypothetical protein
MKTYPDVSSILCQKSERRRRQATLTFEEKIAIVNKWRELTRQIKTNRPQPSTVARRVKRAEGNNDVN